MNILQGLRDFERNYSFNRSEKTTILKTMRFIEGIMETHRANGPDQRAQIETLLKKAGL